MAADIEDIDADFSIAQGDDVESIAAEFVAGLVGPGEFDPLDDAGSAGEEGILDSGGGLEVAGHALISAFKSGVGVLQLDMEAVKFEVGFDAGVQFLHLEGLGDVVDAAKRERPDLVERFRKGADEDDWNSAERFVGLELFTDLVAVHVGHIDIEEDEVRGFSLGGEEGELSVGDGPDLMAAFLEHAGKDLQVRRGIVDDEDISGGWEW
jgi:hypothetical protein